MSEPIHIISVGAGIQSSTVVLKAAMGEMTPMPDFGVFADTGNETKATYTWLEKLIKLVPFKIHVTRRNSLTGSLYDNIFENDHSQIPAFFIDDKTGQIGIGKRQCTKNWKIMPIQRAIREKTDTIRKHLPDGYFKVWQGISTDEASRAKDSREPWIESRFPLLEKQLNRHQCVQWLKEKGFPDVPKSACFFCPYRSNAQWAESKRDPEQWEKIVELDRRLNARGEFLHASCQPIDQVKFDDKDRGQLNLWNNECEGHCGV